MQKHIIKPKLSDFIHFDDAFIDALNSLSNTANRIKQDIYDEDDQENKDIVCIDIDYLVTLLQSSFKCTEPLTITFGTTETEHNKYYIGLTAVDTSPGYSCLCYIGDTLKGTLDVFYCKPDVDNTNKVINKKVLEFIRKIDSHSDKVFIDKYQLKIDYEILTIGTGVISRLNEREIRKCRIEYNDDKYKQVSIRNIVDLLYKHGGLNVNYPIYFDFNNQFNNRHSNYIIVTFPYNCSEGLIVMGGCDDSWLVFKEIPLDVNRIEMEGIIRQWFYERQTETVFLDCWLYNVVLDGAIIGNRLQWNVVDFQPYEEAIEEDVYE